ncbi:MAG: hypothetical protein ABFD89_11305 [Bryobacteraceae bacterium]
MESQSDKLKRLYLMADGDPKWDLSDHDTEAIGWATSRIAELEAALAERNKRIAELEETLDKAAEARIADNRTLYGKINQLEAALAERTQERDALAAANAELQKPSNWQAICGASVSWCHKQLDYPDPEKALAARDLGQQRKGAVDALKPYLWRPIEEANEDYGDIVLVNDNDPGDVRLSHVCSLHWDEDAEGMTHFARVPAFKYAPDQIDRGEVKP